MNKQHKLVTKYLGLIKSNRMTKVEINSMRKALGYCSKLPHDDKQTIIESLNEQIRKKNGIEITPDHSEQGLHYLKGLAFTSKGEQRKTKSMPFQWQDLDVLKNFYEFRLIGLEEVSNSFGETLFYRQIWRTISVNGSYFDYIQGDGQWGEIAVINRSVNWNRKTNAPRLTLVS